MGTGGFDLSFGYGALNASGALGVASPLETKIQSIAYGNSPTSLITITGIARGAGFASYTLEYGSGTQPSSWTQFETSNAPATGALGQFDPNLVANGNYTIRLTAYNTNGAAFSDRVQVLVNTLCITSPAPSTYPTSATSFKPGGIMPITGTAAVGGLQSFQVYWAAGLNATSGWQTTGITLTGGGLTPVENGQLAAWDTSAIPQAGYYTIQLAVAGSIPSSPVTANVYFQPALLSTHWPVWLDQGFAVNAGLVPALNAGGSTRFELTGAAAGATPGALWTLGLDGSAQKTPFTGYASGQQPLAANLYNTPGEQAVSAHSNQICVYQQDLTSTCFPSCPYANFSDHLIVAEDLDGDSQVEVVAVGNDYTNHVAYVYAWRPTGQLVNNHFPIQINDLNPLNTGIDHTRVLVGDFQGDGKKEIVVQDGISSTTYTLRLFAADGTSAPWNVPVLTGTPMAMAAADLDHNGGLETILISYSGSQATLHVFQPDGSERAGWPRQLANPNPSAQSYLAAGDLDRTGREEIVLSMETSLYVFNANGTTHSGAWPLTTGTMGFNAVVIGDIDGDGYPEIVTVRNDVISNTYADQKLLAIRRDGTTAQTWQLTGMNGYDLYTYPLPAIGDFNQDGITDIAVAYDVTSPDGLLSGVVTILSTGAPYAASAMDWPMAWHDARGTAVRTAALATATAVIPSPSPSWPGQTVNFGATVASVPPGGSATGTVFLLEGTAELGSCVLASGQCQVSVANLTVGTHSLMAKYAGDAHYSPSSAAFSQVVTSSTSTVSLSAASLNFGSQLLGTSSAAQAGGSPQCSCSPRGSC